MRMLSIFSPILMMVYFIWISSYDYISSILGLLSKDFRRISSCSFLFLLYCFYYSFNRMYSKRSMASSLWVEAFILIKQSRLYVCNILFFLSRYKGVTFTYKTQSSLDFLWGSTGILLIEYFWGIKGGYMLNLPSLSIESKNLSNYDWLIWKPKTTEASSMPIYKTPP